MTTRASRSVGFVVVLALTLAACGGGTSTQTIDDSGATPDTSSPSSGAVGVPPLLEDGVVSDAALAVVLTPDGQPDGSVLQALATELLALPIEEQEATIADLAARTELAAAALSGLDTAVGDGSSTEAALAEAGTQIRTQMDATVAASLVSGFRQRDVSSPAPSAGGGVAALGLFLGYMALGTFATVAVEASNKIEPGEDSLREGDGMAIGFNLEEVDMELKYSGEQGGVDVEFVASVSIHPCPAADGTFTVDASIDVKASKNGVGQNATVELKIDGTVDDNAELASKNIENHTQWSDYGGGKGQFVDFTYSGPDGLENGTMNRTGGSVTDDFTRLSTTLSSLVGLMMATQILNATEKGWKSGRCVELKLTPSAGPSGLSPSEVVNVLAEPRSKVDGSPTGGTVTGTLSAGGASLDPSGSSVPADATFSYTAPDEVDESGTLTFEARSRRGIGKAELTLDTKRKGYVASGGTEVTFAGTVPDLEAPFQLQGTGTGFGVVFSFNPTSADAGTLSYSGSGGGASMSGNGTYTISGEDPTLTLAYAASGCVDIGGCRDTTNTITLTREGAG